MTTSMPDLVYALDIAVPETRELLRAWINQEISRQQTYSANHGTGAARYLALATPRAARAAEWYRDTVRSQWIVEALMIVRLNCDHAHYDHVPALAERARAIVRGEGFDAGEEARVYRGLSGHNVPWWYSKAVAALRGALPKKGANPARELSRSRSLCRCGAIVPMGITFCDACAIDDLAISPSPPNAGPFYKAAATDVQAPARVDPHKFWGANEADDLHGIQREINRVLRKIAETHGNPPPSSIETDTAPAKPKRWGVWLRGAPPNGNWAVNPRTGEGHAVYTNRNDAYDHRVSYSDPTIAEVREYEA